MKSYLVVMVLALGTVLTACDRKDSPTTTVGQIADNSTITTKAKAALISDSDLKANNISVETLAAVVTLTGNVADEVQTQKAVDLVRAVDGVKNVVNKITVKQVFYRPLGTSRVRVT